MTNALRGVLLVVLFAARTATATDPPVATLANSSPAVDRLELGTTAVTGNRELPRVMSIVPWKAPEPPGGPDRPMGSLIEEVLAPLDRDEFRREVTYFEDLSTQSSTDGGPATAPPAGIAGPVPTRGQSTVATGDSHQ